MRVRLSLLTFVAFLCATPAAHALKQPLGPEFNISNPSPAGASTVSVAADSDTGRYLAVWTPGGDQRPRGRLIDRDGSPLTDEFVIADEPVSFLDPEEAVAYNAAVHEYVVAWASAGSGLAEVRAQRVSASGARIGGIITVRSTVSLGGPPPHLPSVACSSRSGACLVVWKDPGGTLGARLIGLGGTPHGPEVILSSHGGQIWRASSEKAVEYARGADRYLVAWWDDIPLFSGIYTAIFDARGHAGGSGLRIAGGFGMDGLLAYDPGGRQFGALYSRYSAGTYDVTGAKVGEDGNVTPTGDLGGGAVSATSLAFDSRDRSYLAVTRNGFSQEDGGGSFLSTDLTPIAPADFAAGYGVTYNAAADEYLMVRPSCPQPGNLQAVCGRRVGNPRAAADRTGPVLRLSIRRLQRVVRQRGLVLRARCGEACTVRASARIALPGAHQPVRLRRVTRSLAANARAKLKLKTSTRALRKLRRALRTRRRLGARLTVTAADPSGNRSIERRRVRARR